MTCTVNFSLIYIHVLHAGKNMSDVGFLKDKNHQKHGIIVSNERILFCQHKVIMCRDFS